MNTHIEPRTPSGATLSFPELNEVNRKSRQFRLEYLKHCLIYPFHFLRFAPIGHWPRIFKSTHNVASALAVSKCALRNQSNMWERSALRQRLTQWGRSRAEEARRRETQL